MVNSIVIGLGETGGPLQKVLGCSGYDINKSLHPITPGAQYEFLHICIPYHEGFLKTVQSYIDRVNPRVIVIHSTVPIGTTDKIPNAVHSPILGKHGNMEESIRKFPKWVGGDRAFEAAEYFRDHGLEVIEVPTSQETEALKLLCLAKYGMSIAFAQYCDEIAEKLDFPYEDVLLWDEKYNEFVEDQNLKRPLLSPPGSRIGGHCIIQNTKLLDEQFPNPILKEILKYA